jgi:type VI secretion system Hcp family effector
MSPGVCRVPRLAVFACIVSVLAVLAPPPGGAAGADLIHLKLGDIKGESTSEKHKDEIVVLAFSQSFNRPGSCSPFSILKQIDRASPTLIASALAGTVFPRADITVDREADLTTYLTFTLEQVRVDSVQLSDSSFSNESIGLSFGTLTMQYSYQAGGGVPQLVTTTVTCGRTQ